MISIDHFRKRTSSMKAQNAVGNTYDVKFNIELIKHDIERMKGELGKTKNKIDNKNIEKIIKLLEKTVKTVQKTDGVLQFSWTTDTKYGLPITYPINFIDEPLYKINMCNYIELNENQKLVYVPLMDLAEIIAYEYVHKDCDKSISDVDKMLDECTFLGNNKASMLLSKIHLEDDNIYTTALSMKIDDTGFGSADENVLHDYFYTREFDFEYGVTTYKDVINYSCKYANSIIASEICSKIEMMRFNVNTVAINATSIALIVTDSYNTGEEITADCVDTIVISAFGRKFALDIKPYIL